MSIRTLYGTSLYQSGEASLLIYRKDTLFNGTAKGILAFHGHGASAAVFTPEATGNTFAIGTHAAALAEAGYIVASIDAGGGVAWGNSAAMTAVTNAYDWLTSTVGAATGKVGLLGWSMGGLTALNWAKSNKPKVATCYLFAPATDLDYFHDNATYTAEIDAAYGGNYAINSVGYNPIDDASTFTNAGIPMRLLHGTADAMVPPAQTTTYVAAVNDSEVTEKVLTGAGHTGQFGYISVDETAHYFLENH